MEGPAFCAFDMSIESLSTIIKMTPDVTRVSINGTDLSAGLQQLGTNPHHTKGLCVALCKLKTLPHNMNEIFPCVEVLDLSWNGIETLEGVVFPSTLKKLCLFQNPITRETACFSGPETARVYWPDCSVTGGGEKGVEEELC